MYPKTFVMKKPISFVYFFFLIVVVNCSAQMKDEEKLANNFINSLFDDHVKSESVAERFLKYKHDENGKRFITNYINLIRADLKKEGIKLGNLKIVNFQNAKEQLKELEGIDQIDKNQIYAVLNNNELLFPLLLQENKVVSFTTMNKGKRFFIEY
jgi:hypothetical protein